MISTAINRPENQPRTEIYRTVITGAGIVCPLGCSRQSVQAALCDQGQCLTRKQVSLGEANAISGWVGSIDSFDGAAHLGKRGLRALNRVAQLLIVASKLTIEESGWDKDALTAAEAGIVSGTMFCGAHTIASFDRRAQVDGPSRASPLDFANTVINAATGQAALWHGLTGINATISTGNTSGIAALACAADLIELGKSKALLAGGVEELGDETTHSFQRSGQLCTAAQPSVPFAQSRSGFCVAEGAATLMLEQEQTAVSRGATVLGSILGYGMAFDCQVLLGNAPDEEAAVAALVLAIEQAIRKSDLTADDIDAISVSGNGSIWADRIEALALARVFGERIAELPLVCTKASLGESLGAAGAIQAVMLLTAMQTSQLPGTCGTVEPDSQLPRLAIGCETRSIPIRRGLVVSYGFDGNCWGMVLGGPEA